MPLKLFISYSHKDEEIKNELDKFLILLKKSNKISVWQDRMLLAGEDWNQTILKELEEADIIVLLISQDFIASEYIWEKELKIAIQHHEEGKARVIPIIARNCDWEGMNFAKLQALPVGAKPIISYPDKDVAYTEIAKGINKVVDFMLKEKS